MNELVPATTLLSFIERAARDTAFDVAKFGELLKLQRDAEHDQAKRSFNAAMAQAQAEMLPVVRDARNEHLRNKYARLETIDAAIRPMYTRHGFSVRFGSAPAPEGSVRVTCTVAHSAGYFEENYLDAPLSLTGSQGGRMAVTPVQALGSTVTYLRRYLLCMVFNVVLDDDDDGEGSRARPAPAGSMREAAQQMTAPRDDREAMNAAVPLKDTHAQPKFAAWFAALQLDVAQAQSSAGMQAIKDREKVQQVLAAADEGKVQADRAAQVRKVLDEGDERIFQTPQSAPASEDGWPLAAEAEA